MAMTDVRPTGSTTSSEPSTARRILRSDLYRIWVSMGVALALIVSFIAAFRAGEGAGASSGSANHFDVRLTEFAIEPKTINAEAGTPIVLDVHNDGAAAHNLAIQGAGATDILSANQEATLAAGVLDAGRYALFCEIAGHRESGMEATLVVGEGGSTTGHAMTSDEMDASYLEGLKSFPAETKGLGDQILDPEVVGGVKVFELTASEFDWEVAPGDTRRAMGYNGVVPGPQLRVKQGDKMRVVLHNELDESTAIHFHGQNLPNSQDGVAGITQDLVKPGQSYTYEFAVENSGTQIYHSHMNGANQVPLGLWGAFIVEGPNEPDVDHDVNLTLNDGPLGFTINGKSFPATKPIVAKPGEKVRVRYLNEGLQGHPMHLHGMEQLVIAKDGWDLPAPYRADTIWVAPGERYDVIVTARPGVWAFHCHILSHAENEEGMFGMVTAVVVE